MKSSETEPNHQFKHDNYKSDTNSYSNNYKQKECVLTSNCVAICSVGELFGGVERHILGILNGLSIYKINPLLIFFHDGELADQARQQGFNPIILPSPNRSILKTSFKLAHILRQKKIRLVHVHGYKATVFCTLARCWHSFAMIKTEHGLPEPMLDRPIRSLYNGIYHYLDSTATRLSHATVCYVTQDILAYYRRAHSRLKTTVIPNGVDPIDRNRLQRPPELREDCFNLIIVGRVDTVKGHHLAIEAIATDPLSPASHLHIVGTGPREPELRDLAKNLGVAHRVHFLGFRRNVYNYIAHCHVLLMPSLHEGLPYTLLEAMALGAPVIASEVGGLAEVLQNDKTALLFPPGNAVALAQQIARLRDPSLRHQLGESALHLQQSHYSSKAMTDRYLTIYRDAMSGAS